MRRLFTLFLTVVMAVVAYAQNVSVEARISAPEILVGQQVELALSAIASPEATVQFPIFKPLQYITHGVEVVSASATSTEKTADGFTKYSQKLVLTSFVDTLYYIPPIEVKVDNKAYKSEPVALKVMTVDVDTLHPEKFFGPKTVQDNPFSWSDWTTSIWMTVVILLLLGLSYYLYRRLRDNKPIIVGIKVIKKLLPHQKAMREIEQIKADKMVSSEDAKAYYTKLTDTIRRYIEERYGFSAMEMTSSEIIEKLMSQDDKQSLDELRQLFTTADLVKFAKYSTLINENDANLVSAIDFINSTKQEDVPTEERQMPQLSDEDKRKQTARRWLKWSIIALLTISALMLIYVLWDLYQLLI